MNDFSVCVACLSANSKVHHVRNTQYHQIYESLANLSLNLESGIPDTICFICYSQLLKCYKFMKKAQNSGRKLTQLLLNAPQLTQDLVLSLDEKATSYLVTYILKPVSFLPGDCKESNKPEEIKEVVDDSPMNGIINTMAASKGNVLLNIKVEPELDIEEEVVTIKQEYVVSADPTHYEDTPIKEENDKAMETEPKREVDDQVDDKGTVKMNDDSKINEKLTNVKKKKSKKGTMGHVCATCGTVFSCKSYLTRHERTHTGEKPFACKSCDKTFAQNGHLLQHMRLHTGERPYACHICKNKAFNHRYNYKTHMRKHFGVPAHKCDVCTSVFHQKADLKRHILTHTGEKPYTCEICDMKFSQSGHLKQHIRKHSKYTCTVCQVTFSQKSEFNKHLTTHTGRLQYVCDMPDCTKAFNRQSTLSNHMKTHSGDRPYTCDVCCKTFKEKGHLAKHNNSSVHGKRKEINKDKVESDNHFESLQNQVEPQLSDIESQQTPKVVVQEIAQEDCQNQDHLLGQRYLQEQEEYIIP